MKPVQLKSVSIILIDMGGVEEVVEVWDDSDRAEDRVRDMIQDHDDVFHKMNSSQWSNGDGEGYGDITYRIVKSTVNV